MFRFMKGDARIEIYCLVEVDFQWVLCKVVLMTEKLDTTPMNECFDFGSLLVHLYRIQYLLTVESMHQHLFTMGLNFTEFFVDCPGVKRWQLSSFEATLIVCGYLVQEV